MTAVCRRIRRPARHRGHGSAAIDAEDLGDLRSLLPGRYADLKCLARLYRRNAVAFEDGGMKESIPRAVRQLDKSKPPFGFEPFDNSTYRRSRGRLESRWGKARRASEFAQMRIVAVIVEVAASAPTKIPISDQIGFLSSWFTAQSRPREPIVPKNRAGRERINLRRQDCSASWVPVPRGSRVVHWRWERSSNPKVHLSDRYRKIFRQSVCEVIERQNVKSSIEQARETGGEGNHGAGARNQAI